MATQTGEVRLDLVDVGGIHDVADGMVLDRMAHSVAQPKDGHVILFEVVLGQTDLAVKDGQYVLGFQLLRRYIGTVAFEAKSIALGAEQMLEIATVGRVARGTTLTECRLMVNLFLGEIGDLAVATKANVDGVGFGQSSLGTGVGTVAIGAITGGAGMRHLRFVDLLRFVGVTGDAKILDIGLGQHHFAVFGGSVAGTASIFVSKRWMQELGHQLRSG